MFIERLELGPFASNCYLTGDETTREAMVIDPGAEPDRIIRLIDEFKLEVKYIVMTHGHIDHVSALKEVKDATGAPVAIHRGDAGMLGARDEFSPMFHPTPKKPDPPDMLLDGGETFEVGSLTYTVLHTPGHSPGGICLLTDGVVFSGDTLFNMSIGRTDFPGGSMNQIIESIRTKLLTLPDATVVLPGHGPQSTIAYERRANPFLNM